MFSKSNNNNSARKNVTIIKPFCKVCKDSGLPETLYSNHWVKNRDGNVTCPTLLGQNCRCCGKNGHTVSHCPTNKAPIFKNKRIEPVVKINASSKNNPTNVFASLGSDSDSDSDNDEVDEFPILISSFSKNVIEQIQVEAQAKAKEQKTYAMMAAKTEVEFEIQQIISQKQPLKQNEKFSIQVNTKPIVKKSWIQQQMEDSSDEEYEIESSAW